MNPQININDLSLDIVDSLQLGLHVYHLEDITDDRTLRMIYANETAELLTDVSSEKLIGNTLDENFSGLRKKGIPQQYAEVVRSKKPIEIKELCYADNRITAGCFSLKAFPLSNNCVGVFFENLTEKIKIEGALKESHQELARKELLLESIFRSAPIGINLAIDRKFHWVNQKFTEITGYSSDELLGQSARMLFVNDEEFIRVGKKVYGSLEKHNSGSIDTQWVQKDGSIIDVFLSATNANLDYLPNGVTFTVLDISSSKCLEQALIKSKSEWERTFDAITDIITLQTPDMRIVKTNTSGCNALGLPREKIKGHHCYELFNGSSQPCHGCPLLETQKTFAPYTKEMYHEKLGKTFLVSASPVLGEGGELTHIVHVATDITAIKESEEGRMRLAAAIDQASETVVMTDVEGSIQYVNPAFEKLTGYSREEAVGQNPRFLKSDKHDQAFYGKMWKTLLDGQIWSGHMINKKKDGTLFEEEATISPVKNKEGQITNFVAVKRDVSREVSLEKQLRQAMKMEAIGTLAGGIAHDFNNILAVMIGYTEMAREQLSADDPIRKDLAQVLIGGDRATDLVQQILTFSRQGEEDLRPLKVQFIIKEVLKLLRSSLPTTIQLQESVATNCGMILADATQIHQVLMNLCANARHAIGEEFGTLSLSLSEIQVTEDETIADCPQIGYGSYLDLKISDTGCGMDSLTRSMIFDPFYSTKEKGKGTGLGLAVVHGIIRQHKGEIIVSSRPGQGTTFHIYLPVIDEEEAQVEKIKFENMPRGRGERILFVDDEPGVSNMMQRTLDNLGYAVTSFTSSIEALEAYKANPGNFDLVITDMTMPEMTGVHLTRELLALQPDLPVILCTGFSEAIDEAIAKSVGIREYVKKPVDKYTLAKAIKKALRAF